MSAGCLCAGNKSETFFKCPSINYNASISPIRMKLAVKDSLYQFSPMEIVLLDA